MGFVVASFRRNTAPTPKRCTVSVSSSPSSRLRAALGLILSSCRKIFCNASWPRRSCQRLVDEDENLRVYRLAWLAALLSLIRPAQINLDLLTRIDREEISRIAETFIRVPDGPQRKIVGQFFLLSIRLEEIGKTGRMPKKPISDKTRTA